MMITANLSEPYWEEARRTAGYLRNRITGGHPSTDPLSPYEKCFGTKPHLNHVKVFGVWAFAKIPVKVKDHTARSQKGIFMGYSDSTMGGCRIFLPETEEFILTNHVTFGTSPNRLTRELETMETEAINSHPHLHLDFLKQTNIARRQLEAQHLMTGNTCQDDGKTQKTLETVKDHSG